MSRIKIEKLVVFAVNLVAISILLELLENQINITVNGPFYAHCIYDVCTMLFGARLFTLAVRVWEEKR